MKCPHPNCPQCAEIKHVNVLIWKWEIRRIRALIKARK
jgi:hypothetical protein